MKKILRTLLEFVWAGICIFYFTFIGFVFYIVFPLMNVFLFCIIIVIFLLCSVISFGAGWYVIQDIFK